MGDGVFEVEVLKNALKSLQSDTQQREKYLKSRLDGLHDKTHREKALLLGQVSDLKKQLANKGLSSPKELLSDVSTSLSNVLQASGTTLLEPGERNEEDNGIASGSLDHSEWLGSSLRILPTSAALSPMNHDVSADFGNARAAGAAAGSHRLLGLESKVHGQVEEIRELQGKLREREKSVSSLQQEHGTLIAKIEERTDHVASLKSQISSVRERIERLDAFGPPLWMVNVGEERRRETMATILDGASGCNNWHMCDVNTMDLAPNFNEFKVKFEDNAAVPLKEMVQSFLTAFLLKNPKISDYNLVHSFLGAMENPIKTNKLWSGLDEDELADAIDALETMILRDTRVYPTILKNMGKDWKEKDDRVADGSLRLLDLMLAHSMLEYISHFRNPKRFGGERQYFLVQLQTAVTFIDNLTARASAATAELDTRNGIILSCGPVEITD
eukprot:768558-Hanusia_phi.AAC.4